MSGGQNGAGHEREVPPDDLDLSAADLAGLGIPPDLAAEYATWERMAAERRREFERAWKSLEGRL